MAARSKWLANLRGVAAVTIFTGVAVMVYKEAGTRKAECDKALRAVESYAAGRQWEAAWQALQSEEYPTQAERIAAAQAKIAGCW